MGLLLELTTTPTGTPDDAGPLRDLLSAVSSVDGSVDARELTVIGAMYHCLPQLMGTADSPRPPIANRKKVVESLRSVAEPRLRRQLWVVAVEVALSSDGAHQAEDEYLQEVQKALGIDDRFARATIEVLAAKYACGR